MKTIFLAPLLLLPVLIATHNQTLGFLDELTPAAAPNVAISGVTPVDEANNLYYISCAPRTSNAQASAQLSVKFKIKNNENKPLTLNNIAFVYINNLNGQPVVKKMVMDINDASVTTLNILPGDSITWQNSRDYHQVDNALLMESPIPTFVTIILNFNEYSKPFSFTRNLRKYDNKVTGGAYSFPGKETELGINEYWYGYCGHGGGSQFYAYDLKTVGWDSEKNKWSVLFPGTDGSKNEHYRGYGKSVVSIADGVVVNFKDGVIENDGDQGGGSGGGNWFKINNGKETIIYMHMQPGSLTKSLMKVGAKVNKGDKLGLVGNAGSSSEPHLHLQAIDDADGDESGVTVPINFSGIHIIDKDVLTEPNPNAAWEKVVKQGLPYQSGRRCVIWPSASKPCWYPKNLSELSHHAIPENAYQADFDKMAGCNYYPVWVDAYDVNGKTYFNTIFRYNANNYPVHVRHNMSASNYQSEYNTYVMSKGYRLLQLDSYHDAGILKFAAIFIKKPGQSFAQPAYHAVTPQTHQDFFEKFTKQGLVPVNVTVTSLNGKLFYSAFYEKRSVGGMILKSFLTQQEYQDLFDEMAVKRFEQAYINAYTHNDQTRFSAIFYQNSGQQSLTATRKSSSANYHDKWEANTGNGLLTQCVTGYDEGGKHWFAAHWSK